MAEGFFNRMSKVNSASSAGSIVDAEGSPGMPPGARTAEAMSAVSIDVSSHKRRQLEREMFDEAGMVIVLLTKEERKTLPEYVNASDKTRYWDVTDIRGTDYAHHVNGREKIRGMVSKLVDEIG